MLNQRYLAGLTFLLVISLHSSLLMPERWKRSGNAGKLRCGIVESSPGFSSIDDSGQRVGFDIDHCKTISAAVFGEIRIEYIPVTPHTVFTLLQSGGIDIFPAAPPGPSSGTCPWALTTPGSTCMPGRDFLVRKDAGVKSVADLDGRPSALPRALPWSRTLPIISTTMA